MMIRKTLAVVLLAVLAGVPNATLAQCDWPSDSFAQDSNREICEFPPYEYYDAWGGVSMTFDEPIGYQFLGVYMYSNHCDCDYMFSKVWDTHVWPGSPLLHTSRVTLKVGYDCPPLEGVDAWADEGTKEGCARYPTPILINFDHGADVKMTNAEDGVSFDLEGTGAKMRLGWTEANSDVAWLISGNVVNNGLSMYGGNSPQASLIESDPLTEPNGFRALRLEDKNSDGQISAADGDNWKSLNLWFDNNHNATAEDGEIEPLSSRVRSFSLDYKQIGKRDQHGNSLNLVSEVELIDGTKRFTYDVFPVVSSELSEKVKFTITRVKRDGTTTVTNVSPADSLRVLKEMKMTEAKESAKSLVNQPFLRSVLRSVRAQQ